MNGCESWTIQKVECRRINAFELWCWRRLLRVPWRVRSNQSILEEINPEDSLDGLVLKLKLRYFGHLMWRADSFEKTLMLGKSEDRRRGRQKWDGWMASPTRWTWIWVNWSWWWTGKPGVLQYMELERVRHDLGTEQWTTTSHFYTVQNAQLLIKSLEGKSSYLFNSIISVCW